MHEQLTRYVANAGIEVLAARSIRPPAAEDLDTCVHCGFCLPTCPTYVLWGEEMDSPRGRIVLMDAALRETDVLSDAMVTHWDRCLGCMACVTACPSGVQYDRLIERARTLIQDFDVRGGGPTTRSGALSGGNQQKVVLGKALATEPRIMLLDEPTRGVDVGARSEIYNLVRALADRGVAVVVVSSEVEEVLGLSDRVLVISEGRVVHEGPAADIDEHRVLDLVMEGSAA